MISRECLISMSHATNAAAYAYDAAACMVDSAAEEADFSANAEESATETRTFERRATHAPARHHRHAAEFSVTERWQDAANAADAAQEWLGAVGVAASGMSAMDADMRKEVLRASIEEAFSAATAACRAVERLAALEPQEDQEIVLRWAERVQQLLKKDALSFSIEGKKNWSPALAIGKGTPTLEGYFFARKVTLIVGPDNHVVGFRLKGVTGPDPFGFGIGVRKPDRIVPFPLRWPEI